MAGFVERELTGWGRYPRSSSRVYRPEKQHEVATILSQANGEACLARGLGRSYGDAALCSEGRVILTRRLNRFLSLDPQSGELECEAGVTLDDILTVALPQGWFPPVTPGTKWVSVGGAVACDVHGKNHHQDGSISRHVEWIDLLLADQSLVRCSREENSELFLATVGGLGLTGIILGVKLRLKPVQSAFLRVDYFRSDGLEETMRLLEEEDDEYQYSVAWVDCLASGRSMGRSVLIRGNHCPPAELSPAARAEPFRLHPRGGLTLPLNLPELCLNPLSIRAMNTLYYRRFKRGHSSRIEHYEPFFYPLDRIQHWNRAYGKRGFVQYQCSFPPETSERGLTQLLGLISESGMGSFLAVLKRFGEADGLLGFPSPGFTLALDFPMKGDRLLALLQRLDEVVLDCGGRVYLAKDARLSPDTFRKMYPAHDQWETVRRQADPDGRFSSDLAQRVGLGGSR